MRSRGSHPLVVALEPNRAVVQLVVVGSGGGGGAVHNVWRKIRLISQRGTVQRVDDFSFTVHCGGVGGWLNAHHRK